MSRAPPASTRTGAVVLPTEPLCPARIRVLIAHNRPLICAGLQSFLSGFEELELRVQDFRKTGPDLASQPISRVDVVLTDYESGLQLLAVTRAYRVIILTDTASEAAIRSSFAQGASGYFLFSCGPEDLRGGIRAVHRGELAFGTEVTSCIGDLLKSSPLTQREVQVLQELMLGLTNKSIAQKLNCTVGTVKTHVKSILDKLGAENRTQAVTIAQRRGILLP